MNSTPKNPYVAIACGGTGGHLFPGLAVAEELQQRGCDVALLVSPKDVDQQAVKSALERRSPTRRDSAEGEISQRRSGTERVEQQRAGLETGAPFEVFTLPAVGLQNRNYFSFAASFVKSLFAARNIFRQRRPQAVLAMGGFTSAPPIFVAKELGAKTFLHESNTIPGKANRYLSWFVHEAFVGFPETASRLKARKVTATGTPVRPQFSPLAGRARESAALKLGLDPSRPVVLVVGGSQGATGLNTMVLSALPLLAKMNWQWLHLTGANDFEKVRAAYAESWGINAIVRPFLAEMDLALGVASAAVSRAGASSLAELAAMRLPCLLVPFPAAADNHQFFNARIYAISGAARLLEQRDSTPEKVAALLAELVGDDSVRARMNAALALWHYPKSAEQIAVNILRVIRKGADVPAGGTGDSPVPSGDPPDGMGEASLANQNDLSAKPLFAVPVGGSSTLRSATEDGPTGAVESPASPIFQAPAKDLSPA